jgi:pycsar effector protein
MTETPVDKDAVEYARRAYGNVLNWYDNADRKAQLILTANGGFLTVLVGFALSKPVELTQTLDTFGPETWLFAGIAAASIVVAFASAALALFSRLHSPQSARKVMSGHGVDVCDPTTYDPSVLWFFQFVAQLDESAYERRLRTVTAGDEIDSMADEMIQLSQRVTSKHHWVNVGFIATTIALSFLLAMSVSYAVRLAI